MCLTFTNQKKIVFRVGFFSKMILSLSSRRSLQGKDVLRRHNIHREYGLGYDPGGLPLLYRISCKLKRCMSY